MDIVNFTNIFFTFIEQTSTLSLIAMGGKLLFVITIFSIVVRHAWAFIIAILASLFYILKVILCSIVHIEKPKTPKQIKDLKNYPLFSLSHYFRVTKRVCQFTSKCWQTAKENFSKNKKASKSPLSCLDSEICNESTNQDKIRRSNDKYE